MKECASQAVLALPLAFHYNMHKRKPYYLHFLANLKIFKLSNLYIGKGTDLLSGPLHMRPQANEPPRDTASLRFGPTHSYNSYNSNNL